MREGEQTRGKATNLAVIVDLGEHLIGMVLPEDAIAPGRHPHLFFTINSLAFGVDDVAIVAVSGAERRRRLLESSERLAITFFTDQLVVRVKTLHVSFVNQSKN